MKKKDLRWQSQVPKPITNYQLKALRPGDIIVVIASRGPKLVVTEVKKLVATRPNCITAYYYGDKWDVPFECIVKKLTKEKNPEYFL